MEIKRRDFLKLSAVSAGSAAVVAAATPALASAKSEEIEHKDKAAMLVDTTICIGCRACVIACKQWNHNSSSPYVDADKVKYTSVTPLLDSNTFTNIRVSEVKEGGQPVWVYTKIQCMHCDEPACVTACPIKAMRKTKEGPVIYDKTKCFGCRYCMVACPFHIPEYEWDSTTPWVRKCTFCFDRQKNGLQPACFGTCPTGALKFGKRGDLIEVARKRIADNPGKYYDHIYGEKELGGTSWIYLASVPFEEIGFTKFSSEPVPKNAERAMKMVPPVLLGVAIACTGLYWYVNRREKNQANKDAK